MLGPLEVRRGSEVIAVAAGRERVLLATLLLRAGQLVPLDELVDRLWDGETPNNPKAALHMCVNRLRNRFGDARDIVRTGARADGYLVTPEWLDLAEFRRLVDEAGRVAEPSDAAGLLRQALALWRGTVLGNVASESLHRDVVPALVEERTAVWLRRIGLDLALGRAAEVVPELRGRLAEHPLHEGVWAHLVRALHGSGRTAEALAAYDTIRRQLADELGVDPGDELRRLHLEILAPPSEPVEQGPPTPRQLPPAVRTFTGRAAELAQLDARLARHVAGDAGAVVITAISGTAGVGKTALAVHWARRIAGRFPDGQLWVNLRGYDPDQPLTAEQALTIFLRALGVPGPEVPLELDAQTGLFRSLLADRRMLLVLDNASSADQVRPLLPGAPGCLALITSRDDLPGLVARDGATRVRLGLLDRRDSITLLRRLIGTNAAEAELERVATFCARLPLALRIAADRLTAPDRPLGKAVAELTGEPRLDAFAAGNDPHTATRAVFSWSYRLLAPEAATLFRRLGAFPGDDWDTGTAAALLDVPLAEARRLLDRLVVGHLLEPDGDRYRMHDLLRAYAVELSFVDDEAATRHDSITRGLDNRLACAVSAMDAAYAFDRPNRPPISLTPQQFSPPIEDADGWLDLERANLVATVFFAGRHGWPRHAIELAATIRRYLLFGAHHETTVNVYEFVRKVAARTGDRAAEGAALHYLGAGYGVLGKYDKAFENFRAALAAYEETGNANGAANAHRNLGIILLRRGRYDEALDHFQRAASLFEAAGDPVGKGQLGTAIGEIYLRRGQYDLAALNFEETLEVSRVSGNRETESFALANLAHVDVQRERYDQAAERYRHALDITRELGDREGEADVLTGLGRLLTRTGRFAQALARHQESAAVYRTVDNKAGEAEALNGAGEASRGAALLDQAAGYHRSAMTLADELGEGYEIARALEGLGQVRLELGDPAGARELWQRALQRYQELGVADVDRVRRQLALVTR